MAGLLDSDQSVVRVAMPADASALAAIHALCFARAWDEAALAQFLGVPGSLALVASRRSDGAAQGFLIARAAADEAELLTLCVLPEHRRQGLAQTLLAAASGMLRAGGTKCLFLEVDEENAAAIALYRALGAMPVGRRAGYYEHGGNAAIFSLALSGRDPDDDT